MDCSHHVIQSLCHRQLQGARRNFSSPHNPAPALCMIRIVCMSHEAPSVSDIIRTLNKVPSRQSRTSLSTVVPLVESQSYTAGRLSWLTGNRICSKTPNMPLLSATPSMHIADSSLYLNVSRSFENMIFVCCACGDDTFAPVILYHSANGYASGSQAVAFLVRNNLF
ncbi:hypothetical protein BDV34DRAFT_186182, partial [Aspergillus parasiticus]